MVQRTVHIHSKVAGYSRMQNIPFGQSDKLLFNQKSVELFCGSFPKTGAKSIIKELNKS